LLLRAQRGVPMGTTEQEGWSFAQYVRHLAMLEVEERRRGRVARNLKASQLPSEKTLATLRQQRLPAAAAKRLPALCEGAFVERCGPSLSSTLSSPWVDSSGLRAVGSHERLSVREIRHITFFATLREMSCSRRAG
jgi:hypothetical protein